MSWSGMSIVPLCGVCRDVMTKRSGQFADPPDGEYVGIHHRNLASFRKSSRLPCMFCSAVWTECASNKRYNIVMDGSYGYVTRWKIQDYDDAVNNDIKYPNAVVLTIVIPRTEIRQGTGVGAVKDHLPMCSFVLVPAAGGCIKS